MDEAASTIIHHVLNAEAGNGGLIAVDKDGNFAMPFNSSGMYRGYIYKDAEAGKWKKGVGIGNKMVEEVQR